MSRWLLRALLAVVDRLDRHPLATVLGAVLLAAAGLIYTAGHLRIDTSTTEMISADVPFRQHDTAFRRAFPRFTETIVAVIEGAVPERVEQAASALAEALRADPAHFTDVDYPAGDPFFAREGLLYLDVDQLGQLADRLATAQPMLAALAADPTLRGLADLIALVVEHEAPGGKLPAEMDRLLGEMAEVVEAERAGRYGELSWRRALASDPDAGPSRALIVAQPHFDHGSMAPAAAAITALRAAAEQLAIDQRRGLRLSLTGAAVLDHEELESVGEGAAAAALVSATAVTVLLIWGLRSARLIAASLITLGIGLLLTAAFAALAVGRLNLISVTFAVLFVGLGVDFAIHLVLRYREGIAAGERHELALRSAVRGVAGPLSLSALCAGLGFLAFVPTAYQGLAELGVISAAGMAIAWLVSLTLLPALLSLMPLAPRAAPGPARPRRAPGRGLHVVVVGTAALGVLASLPALPKVTFDFNPLNLKNPVSESMRTFRALAADPATSPQVIDLLAASLEEADREAGRLQALDQVERALTLSSLVPKAQDEKLELIDPLVFYLAPALQPADPAAPLDAAGRRAALARLAGALSGAVAASDNPGAAALAAALDHLDQDGGPSDATLSELETRLTGTLPELLERLRLGLEAAPVALDDLPEDVRSSWLNGSGQARVLVQPADVITDNAGLERFARAVLAAAPDATGTPVVVVEAGEVVVGAFREASWIALGLITLVLILVLRNLRDILLVLAPLGIAVLFTAATMVGLDLALNFANVIVLPLLLGLGVSGAIHVVMRHRQLARLGVQGDVTITSTPRAVLFSALTTIASFGSLATAAHPGLASMGLLLTVAIAWSLICTLVILPSMLALIETRARAEGR